MRNNFCRRGAQCTFAHSVTEMRQRPTAAYLMANCQYKRKLCKFWNPELANSCTKGDQCDFYHCPPCKYFLAGTCKKGRDCYFQRTTKPKAMSAQADTRKSSPSLCSVGCESVLGAKILIQIKQ